MHLADKEKGQAQACPFGENQGISRSVMISIFFFHLPAAKAMELMTAPSTQEISREADREKG